MPCSIAASTTLRVASRSSFIPKLLQPSPTSDTCKPDFPSVRSSTSRLLWRSSQTFYNWRDARNRAAWRWPMTSTHRTLGRNDLIASSYTLSGSAVFQPPRFSFAERVAAAASAGFAAIGLAVEDYAVMRSSSISDAELLRIAADHGIAIAELEFLTNWWCDDEKGNRSRELEEKFYAAAEVFGVRHMNVGSPGMRGALPALEIVAERFGTLCDRPAHHNLLVAF